MPFVSVPWAYQEETNNGVWLFEVDCELECEVRKFGNGDPELSSVVSIYVYGDGKVADLLNSDAGQTELGEKIRKRALHDRDFAARAIEQCEKERNHWGNAADARRAMMMAE